MRKPQREREAAVHMLERQRAPDLVAEAGASD
jgi:hypothetical protein